MCVKVIANQRCGPFFETRSVFTEFRTVLVLSIIYGPPCVRDADIIFLPSGFFFYLSSFFPRLISAVADWMSAILPHMVWPSVRILDAGLKRAARGSLKIQNAKNAKNSPSGHHRATLSGYITATEAHIDNRKELVKQQYLPHMSHNMATSAH